jgi:hypothetical protein
VDVLDADIVAVSPTRHARLNSAIGYITPNGMLAGRQPEIRA